MTTLEALASQKCVPCREGTAPLTGSALSAAVEKLPGWSVTLAHHLERSYPFPDFLKGLAFVNRVAAVAEEAGHHPDLLLRWGEVKVMLWTHAIDGLSDADFVLAARIELASQRTS